MAIKSLYQVVKELNSKMGKQSVGYNLTGWKDIYANLLKDLYTPLNRIFGINRDYSKVKNLEWLESGFSTLINKGIWKLPMNITGSTIVYCNDVNVYAIATFNNLFRSNIGGNPLGHSYSTCPQSLTQDEIDRMLDGLIVVGAAIPLNHTVLYFQRFAASTTAEKIQEKHIYDLITAKCLAAQIIFPDKNLSLIIDVLQGTANETVCVYVPTVVFATKNWNTCGIKIRIRNQLFIPDGTTYTNPLSDRMYNVGKFSIQNYTKEQFNTWHKSSSLVIKTEIGTLEMTKSKPIDCYMRLFVPSDKIDRARMILPSGINLTVIFSTYLGEIKDSGVVNSPVIGEQGDLSVKMDGLAIAWGNVATNSGEFSITYDQNYNRTLYRGHMKRYYSSILGYITPLFGQVDPNSKETKLDCSGFACFMLYNTGVIRKDVQSVTLYGTKDLHKFADYLNGILDSQYKAIHFDIDGPQSIKTGDIIYCTLQLRIIHLGYATNGHAAWAYVTQGEVKTLESNSRQKGMILKNLPRNNKVTENGYFYKHAIRIVKK